MTPHVGVGLVNEFVEQRHILLRFCATSFQNLRKDESILLRLRRYLVQNILQRVYDGNDNLRRCTAPSPYLRAMEPELYVAIPSGFEPFTTRNAAERVCYIVLSSTVVTIVSSECVVIAKRKAILLIFNRISLLV